MTRVDIAITQGGGRDTKYLFPASVTHEAADAEYLGGETYRFTYNVKMNGTTHYHRYFVDGHLTVDDAYNDLRGAVSRWEVVDAANPNGALGAITITDGQYHVEEIDVYSFAGMTPNLIVTSLHNNSRTAELHFIGYTGNDTLRGSYWDDELDGKKGADLMIGHEGNDTYRVNSSGDKVVEAADQGYDRVYTKISYTLTSNVESLVGKGSRGLALTGNGRPNDISGTSANDTMRGEGGNDLLAGADGKDVLYGGKGGDFFMFVTPPSAANVDTVKDFEHSADSIIISQFVHPGLTTPEAYYTPFHPYPGLPIVAPYTPLNPAAFHASASGRAHDFDDRITYDTTDGRLFFDPDGNGAAPRQLIAVLSGHPFLAADDILIL